MRKRFIAWWVALGLGVLSGSVACGSSSDGAANAADGGGGRTSDAGSGGDGGGVGGSGGSPDSADGGAGAPGSGGLSGGSGGAGGMSSTGGSDGATDGGGSFEPDFVRGICRPNGPDLEDVPGVRVIAETDGGADIDSLAMRDGTLYWILDGDEIQRLVPGAMEPELVVETSVAWDLFVTDSHVYWIEGNDRTLMRASLAELPSTAEEVLLDVREMALHVDAENIFFTRRSTGDIYKLPLAEAAPGAEPTTLVPAVGPAAMVSSGDDLYYIDSQTVQRVPVEGGTPTQVSTAGALRDILVVDGMLYLVAGDTLIRQPVDAPPGGDNWTRIAIGNRTSEGSQFNQELEELGFEGDRIYYREEGGAIAWTTTDGTDCGILANVELFSGLRNKKWVMDADYVYVIEDDYRLVAIPK